MSSSRRGQVFSTDLVAAVLLSMLAVGAISMMWSLGKVRLDEKAHIRALEDDADRVSDLLARTGGVPQDWESDPANATSLGLAESDRLLSDAKVEALMGLDEAALRGLLNVGGSGVRVGVRYCDGGRVGSVGGLSGLDPEVTSTRVVTFRGRPVFLEVSVWGSAPEALL